MYAARFHEYGTPDTLVIEDIPEPHAGPHAVRIKVLAASVNPIDVLLRAGRLRSVLPLALPATPGRDAVGVVDEVGPGVRGTMIGDLVFGLGGVSDTTAEVAVLTAWSAVPEGWSIEQAAAAGLASATAAQAIRALDDLSGRTLLVEGASGAVGSAVAAFATAAGARVIGTARPDRHSLLTSIGVEATTYGEGLADRVRALAPEGVHAAVHAAPSKSLASLLSIVGERARVITVIDSEGAAHMGVRHLNTPNDSTLLHFAADRGRQGHYTPHVAQVLPLESIAQAHALSEGGGGKIVVSLTPGSQPYDRTPSPLPTPSPRGSSR